MSGIVAGAQSGGCCCRPLPCQCTNPNRPGAIVDASLTAINIEAEYNYRERERRNGQVYCGCVCAFELQGGSLPEVRYFEQRNGCAVDPDFTDGTDCEPFQCRPGGCPCCPEYSVSATFGSQVLERVGGSFATWATVFRNPLAHLVGSWDWAPQMVGFCIPQDSTNVRVRKTCGFTYYHGVGPGSGVDGNGQYIDENGKYLGGNIGRLNVYSAASVYTPTQSRCYYEARISMVQIFADPLAQQIADEGGSIVMEGGNGIYRKNCLTPFDTALGTYECVYCKPTYIYAEDQECGPFRGLYELDITFPDFITVS